MGPPGLHTGIVVFPNKSNLELIIENLVVTHSRQNEDIMNQNLHANEVLKHLTTMVESIDTHTNFLDTQIS